MKRGPASIKIEAKTTFWSSKMASNSFGGCPSRGSESQVAKKTVWGTKRYYKWTSFGLAFWTKNLKKASKQALKVAKQSSEAPDGRDSWPATPREFIEGGQRPKHRRPWVFSE